MDVFTPEQAVEFESTVVLGAEATLVSSWEPEVPGHRVLVVVLSAPERGPRHYVVVYVDGRRMSSTTVSDEEGFVFGRPFAELFSS